MHVCLLTEVIKQRHMHRKGIPSYIYTSQSLHALQFPTAANQGGRTKVVP